MLGEGFGQDAAEAGGAVDVHFPVQAHHRGGAPGLDEDRGTGGTDSYRLATTRGRAAEHEAAAG
ncbi:hypothetical protein [Streptomyces lavendulae]|uniref:hypothetical protein n=1 Tax=Streptomyces lavendulae TaxID=1914 RepID=UPI0024A0AACD|nr:hypothetical protein [Streptomyces lavendulae]GLX19467.1 hypothetical protein Slala01_31110 [Streptomyces lavendulae subsp. lavendulae]GLX26962.1 hypothetical protein Slala02_27820 [Streptomyces lavendulae subsp. lavendulae]